MSSGFPADDAPLTDDTFNTAYNVILTQIHQETPPTITGNGQDGTMNLETMHTGDATGSLDKWRTYTKDGDLSKLPTGGAATPWEYLVGTAKQKLSPEQSELQNIHDLLVAKWTGTASGQYAAYMQEMQKRLNNYSMEGGHLDQVAGMLTAAFTVEVAFKKDLLETARSASKSLDALDHGQAAEDIGLFCVGLAGVVLSGLSGLDVAKAITGVVFLNSTVGNLVSGFSFAELKDKTVAINDDSPSAIMKNLDSALGKIVSSYQDAATQVGQRMDALLDDLKGETSGIAAVTNVPVVDPTSSTASFKFDNFFPDSANGNAAVQAKISNPPR